MGKERSRLTLNKVNPQQPREPPRRPPRVCPRSIAGDGRPEPEGCPRGPFEPSISGCLTGDLESRAMSPTGYPCYPTPLPASIEAQDRAGCRASGLDRIGESYRG